MCVDVNLLVVSPGPNQSETCTVNNNKYTQATETKNTNTQPHKPTSQKQQKQSTLSLHCVRLCLMFWSLNVWVVVFSVF